MRQRQTTRDSETIDILRHGGMPAAKAVELFVEFVPIDARNALYDAVTEWEEELATAISNLEGALEACRDKDDLDRKNIEAEMAYDGGRQFGQPRAH